MKIGINENICDEREAVISVYDHGFLYGIGLFETFRTYGGRPFLLQEHLDRLQQGLSELGIRYVPDEERIRRFIRRLLDANGLKDGYIRFSVSAGVDVLGLPAGEYEHPNTIVYVKELPPVDERGYETGKALQLLHLRRNSPEGRVRFKSFHYMNNILAKRELQQYRWANGAEGLFLNEKGHLAEGIVSNLFFIRGSVCYTPAIGTGILPGVTRAVAIELAERIGLRTEEGYYDWEQLLAADEVFVTNSIQEIVPVTRLFDTEGRMWTIGGGKAGPLTKTIRAHYREKTGEAT